MGRLEGVCVSSTATSSVDRASTVVHSSSTLRLCGGFHIRASGPWCEERMQTVVAGALLPVNGHAKATPTAYTHRRTMQHAHDASLQHTLTGRWQGTHTKRKRETLERPGAWWKATAERHTTWRRVQLCCHPFESPDRTEHVPEGLERSSKSIGGARRGRRSPVDYHKLQAYLEC
ncbi:hypothetical protein GGX14DRAFT_454245 [Mycena pura]|uniref:Uncharacterized protein n=1 Tax=Mycena pura TaxID=153505 RepID=A0AAD6UVS6_9AGAR|nr:hypothetical protein GGX14DRAFT_473784 [Mycena pura]KAJ7202397.1 hypothetical protein GGX14DRAFT_463499 [Mycena pura]KAJ7208255.1 hypothetical protein GGX14DRAFT_454245 [Mycena pura]